MISKFPFAIIRFEPSPSRGERLNVGVVIFRPAAADVRLEPSYSRQILMREYGVGDDVSRLHGTLGMLAEAGYDGGKWEDAFRSLKLTPRWTLSEIGFFVAENERVYEAEVRSILDDLVAPVGTARGPSNKRRLTAELRAELERVEMLGAELDQGLVVPRLAIAMGSATLRVDFALKAKNVFLIQTVDLSGPDGPDNLREASFKALVADRARKKFPQRTHTVFVVRWSSIETDFQVACREVISAYADSVVDFEVEQQRVQLLADLSRARIGTRDLFGNRHLTVARSRPRAANGT